MTPVQATLLRDDLDGVRKGNAHRERDHGHGVVKGAIHVAVGKVHAKEQDVTGLRVGKDLPACEVRVRIHESARECENCRQLD